MGASGFGINVGITTAEIRSSMEFSTLPRRVKAINRPFLLKMKLVYFM